MFKICRISVASRRCWQYLASTLLTQTFIFRTSWRISARCRRRRSAGSSPFPSPRSKTQTTNEVLKWEFWSILIMPPSEVILSRVADPDPNVLIDSNYLKKLHPDPSFFYQIQIRIFRAGFETVFFSSGSLF